MEKKGKERANDRTRNWALVVYPESAPDNWRDIINESHVQWVESPLHDKDTNGDGELDKKAHWHILLSFESVKHFDQVKEISDKLNAPIPQKCASPQGLIRYMIHLDNPEKFQYERKDIIAHGGMDIGKYFLPTTSMRYMLIAEMIHHINEYQVTSYSDFMTYSIVNRYEDWFPLLCDSCTYVIMTHIKSLSHKMKGGGYDV